MKYIISFFLTVCFSALTLAHSALESSSLWQASIITSPNVVERYYLTQSIEESRHVFRLFRSVNDQYQDLVSKKSFSIEETLLAQQWLKFLTKKYQLSNIKTSELELTTAPYTLTRPTKEVLWEATNEWSSAWEVEYGRWVKENLYPQFMIDFNLPTDCADVAYTLRWIFAFIHKLPMATHLGGSSQLFTHETVLQDWVQYPSDPDWKKNQRLRMAIKYILRNTYTHTLMKDSYPVAIDPTFLTPGTHHLKLDDTHGHTMIVNSVNEPNSMPITLLYSTLPKAIRELVSTFYQEHSPPVINKSGFYKFRWTARVDDSWRIIPAKNIPDYSEEQFHLPSDDQNQNSHFLVVFKKLNPNFSFATMFEDALTELQLRFRDRIQIVEEGYQFCKKNDCAPGSSGDEEWSTPNRDQRLRQLHQSLEIALDTLLRIDYNEYQSSLKKLALQAKVKSFKIFGQDFSLSQLTTALLYQLTQSDPRLSIEERWGVSVQMGYGPTLIKQMNKIIPERRTLIAAAEACKTNPACGSNSDDFFKKFNTVMMDSNLMLLWSGAKLLCKIGDENECQNLKNYLRSYSFENKTYLELFERLALWINNPRGDVQTRWGEQGKYLYISPSKVTARAFFSDDRNWFTLDQKLFQTQDQTAITLGKNEVLGQLHPSTNHYFTFETTQSGYDIRIYLAPHQLKSVTHFDGSNSLQKIFWSSKQKTTLSLFFNDHFYEINLEGQKIQSIPFDKILDNNLKDVKLHFIKINDDVLMSDATFDASTFIKIPFTEKDFSNLLYINRTNLGWKFFNKNKKIFYYYEPKGEVFSISPPFFSDLKIGDDATTAAVTSNKYGYIDIYRRKITPEGLGPFLLADTMEGKGYYFKGKLLIIEDDVGAKAYNSENLTPFKTQCKNQKAYIEYLSGDYYSCFNYNEYPRELYHTSGKLLDKGSDFIPTHEFIIKQAETPWLNTYQSGFISAPNSLPVSPVYLEYYKLTPDKLIGPLFQFNDFTRFEFNYFDAQKSFFAPEVMPMDNSTNFGYLRHLPQIYSRLISQTDINNPLIDFVLYIPNP